MKIKLLLLCFVSSFSLMAQSGKIKGVVKTSDNSPAEFINVAIKGTTKGDITNNKGEFMIDNVAAGDYTLIISFVGLETKEEFVQVEEGETTIVPDIVLNEDAQQLNEIVISDYKTNPYVRERSEYVAKIPLKDIENPQVYNVVSSELMKMQVITNFDDALKNAPGIVKLWESTGRGGDGAGYFSLRGFAVQPTMVNGLPALINGSPDPANIEAIEVIKGPSGTLYGSSLISYGGLINVVTKKPNHYDFGGEVGYTMGSFGLNRVTADVNTPFGEDKDVALRMVAAYHHENSFQDAGFKKSFFVAPSLSYQVNDRLSFLVNTEFYTSEGTNPVMLFLNRATPLQFENMEALNYDNRLSLTSNDITIKNPSYSLQGQMNYKLSDQWTSQTAVSRSFAKSEGYYSYLWDMGDNENKLGLKGLFGLYINGQNASTNSTDIQQNFIGDFKIGNLRNRMVVGIDYFYRNTIDNGTGYALAHYVSPQGTFYDPTTIPLELDTLDNSRLSKAAVDEALSGFEISKSNVKQEIYSAYVSDVINFTPRLSVMASLRVDYFDTEGEILVEDDDFDQVALSPKFGLVYQPLLNKLSVFANYMNGFSNVGPAQVSDINRENPRTKIFEPEHANQIEFGIKTNLFSEKLNASLSYYNIQVANRVYTDPINPNNSIQGGEVESKGIELDLKANPFAGLNLIVGYSYNDSKVLEGAASSAFEEEGKRPGEAGPKNLFNAWASYRFTNGTIRGFGLGLGANAASELIILDSNLTGKFVVPGYTTLKASLFYDTPDFRITLNMDNITDEEYYRGWSTINPQKPRNISANFTYKF